MRGERELTANRDMGAPDHRDALARPTMGRSHERLAERQTAHVERLRKLLRMPGFSATGEGMRESALACLAELKAIGAEAGLSETDGHEEVLVDPNEPRTRAFLRRDAAA